MDLDRKPEKHRFDLDLDTFRAGFLGNLQQMQDHMRACEAGLERLTPDAYATRLFRGGPVIHPPSELGFEAAVDFSRFVLARAFFRDTVDFLQHYLEGCFHVPHLHRSATSGAKDWWKRHVKAFRAFHKCGMPEKLNRLQNEFGFNSPLRPHVLSINAVRNCLVHRLGKVMDEDCKGTNHLELRLRRLTTVLPGHGSGNWQRVQLKKGALTFEDSITTFARGDHVRFIPKQLNECLYTMMLFDDSMLEALTEYFKKKGVHITRTVGEPRFNAPR